MSRFNKEIEKFSGEITKIEVQKKRKDRINIYLDSEYAFSCHIDFIFEFKLERGLILEVSQVKHMVEMDDQRMAYLYGLRMALTRSMSIIACKRKLIQKEFSEEAAEYAVEKLVENQYLDDLRYAQNYFEMKQSIYGRFRIQQDLMRQGVDKSIVISVINENASEELELEEALKIAHKKMKLETKALDQKAFARIYGFLARKGYSASVIRTVMDQMRSQSKAEFTDFNEFE